MNLLFHHLMDLRMFGPNMKYMVPVGEPQSIWYLIMAMSPWIMRKKYNAMLHLGSCVRPPVACAHAIGESS